MNKALVVVLFLLCSCSLFKGSKANLPAKSSKDKFLYTDKNGKYLINTQSGINEKDKTFILKKSIEIPEKSTENILEQSITISDIGSVKKTNILRPKHSQYTVWFDGKKYFSELKVLPKKKSIEVRMQSPESQWNGTKTVKFPTTKLIPCFFAQVIECARTSGFFDVVKKSPKKKMSLLIIWEGYPFLNETYSDFPSELFSKGELEFDGNMKGDERRFNLTVAGQSIFYVLNSDNVFKKMFWVSQGITMLEKGLPAADPNGDDSE